MFKNYQYQEVEAHRKLTARAIKIGYIFVGFEGVYNGLAKSRVRLVCDKHEVCWRSTGAQLNHKPVKCPVCLVENKKKVAATPDEILVARFMVTGEYPEGTTFKRGLKKQTWLVRCPVCSSDEYVQAGVCKGEFLAYSSGLTKGMKSCRCHKGFRFTPEQREYQINKTFLDEGLNYKFLGWVGESRAGKTARIDLECIDHGEFTPLLDSYLNGYKSRCPSCAKYGFNPDAPAYFYVLRTSVFTGYGITCDVKYRMGLHRKHLHRETGDFLEKVVYFPMHGFQAKLLEDEVRSIFPIFENKVPGFVREATSLSAFDEVVKNAESFHDAVSKSPWNSLILEDFTKGERSLRLPYSRH